MVEWEYINLDHSKFVWSTLLSGCAYSNILLLLRVLLHGLVSCSLFLLLSLLFTLTCFSSFVGLFLSLMGPKQTLAVLSLVRVGLMCCLVLFVCDPFCWVPDVGIEEDSCV